MKIDDWLKTSSSRLSKEKLATARLDCLIMLEDVTAKDRGWLLAHPETNLTLDQLKLLNVLLLKRVKHLPMAYIRGFIEFYGRQFLVSKAVLVPRPESEDIIDLLKQLVTNKKSLPKHLPGHPTVIVDIGTGSGALAITAKLELPNTLVIASDISESALTIAKQNAQKHSSDIEFFVSNLLANFPADSLAESPLVVMANLPYVPDNFVINKAAHHEPKIALFGGVDGLDLYRALFAQMVELPHTPVFVITESLPAQHQKLSLIAESYGYQLHTSRGFVQAFAYPIQ